MSFKPSIPYCTLPDETIIHVDDVKQNMFTTSQVNNFLHPNKITNNDIPPHPQHQNDTKTNNNPTTNIDAKQYNNTLDKHSNNHNITRNNEIKVIDSKSLNNNNNNKKIININDKNNINRKITSNNVVQVVNVVEGGNKTQNNNNHVIHPKINKSMTSPPQLYIR